MEIEANTLSGHEDGEGYESLKQGYNPLVAVFAAIAIAVLMASIGYFGFKRPPRDYHGVTAPSGQTSTTTPPSTAVSNTDINKTVDTLDKSFDQLDDNKDFNPADLSDSSLGL